MVNLNENKVDHITDILRGSYSHTSFLSLRDSTRRRGYGSGKRPGLSSNSSNGSYTFLKLQNLSEDKKWETLEDFNLEELRDEFFDPIYTKPESSNEFTDDSEIESLISGKKKSINNNGYNILLFSELYQSFFLSPKQIWEDFYSYKVSIFKFFIAYFIAMVICVVHRSGNWIGHQYRYFLPLAVIIHHPVRTIGVQLEMTLFSILGGALGMGWSALAWYISTATKPVSNHQGGILFGSLVIALMFSTWSKSYFQRLLYFGKTFSIAVIFFHTVDTVTSKHDLRWKLYWDFGISYLFGLLLSLLICVVVSPHSGNQEIMENFVECIADTKCFLTSLINLEFFDDNDKKHSKQTQMVASLNVGLSEGYREFSNQFSISKFDSKNLSELRNLVTKVISPLRVLPIDNKLFDGENIENLYNNLKSADMKNSALNKSQIATNLASPTFSLSGAVTPSQSRDFIREPSITINEQVNLQILRNHFTSDAFMLLTEMILVLEDIIETLNIYQKRRLSSKDLDEIHNSLETAKKKLKRKIYRLDITYREFTMTSYFTKEMLMETHSVSIFLFLRGIRNASKHLLQVIDCCNKVGNDIRWRIVPMHYPLYRSLHRVPKQCSIDEGAGNVLNYFETKRDVDEIFEKLYNTYTSRHKYSKKMGDGVPYSVRAIDHEDFNLHTTTNKWRLTLWHFSTLLVGDEMKWSIKKVFVMVFLCLPAWLPESHGWYQQYQCWWCPMSFYLLSHRKYSGNWHTLMRRLSFCLIGIFWGWAANQARHFGSPYVICTFSGLLVIPIALNILAYKNTRSSFTTMMCFSVIVLETYSQGRDALNTASIWKHTWVTGLSFIIAVIISIPINWTVWSFKARSEVRKSMFSLLAHISQSYQSVTDRYLYRDVNDAPTDFTLALSHIREVRLGQHIEAIRALLEKSKAEPIFISNFNPKKYLQLINLCELLSERILEARISGTYFEVWKFDTDTDTTRALLSLRRDSVSSVIFVLYILSNCYRSKNKIPRYLPSTIMSRKKLYKFISKFDLSDDGKEFNNKYVSSANISLINSKLIPSEKLDTNTYEDFEKTHWSIIHRIAFERAFTDISELLQHVINLSKDILGEEPV
ncbi:hypothetical protein Kpol_1014p37 [Vanderwaltozyma polyspora DSM 70294]|uniref:Integral membrane bound transporter domain-containing protein n=1 Tax=Vanderwaltozyma polyspora (strain ATCC 22028 / DSM 70294 / BCRC 21397 / CBS 2163 / NBRC 10782 / NRRL Y-8283 / UCD 57-17) TaxID=436907 RepID=A7TNG4_VANPO|nr:uncharacterized protein Kpol_1014p37 [Vanderwaltozyma polyspora DSM 70294]EDO16217.1 hypothetical protein Kpol_1014p37 [Vanderwaltozyma polyspora DSM 70294]